MTADLPTEEDVLAMAVLCAIINPDNRSRDFAIEDAVLIFGDDPPEKADRIRPPGALEIARSRRRDGRPWSMVIADSERRLEVEQARDAVIDAVERADSTMPPSVERARTRFLFATVAVR